MIVNKVYDKDKDPKQHFFDMVNYFTEERLRNKATARDTGDRYYKDLEQAQKIVINSAYGMLGAGGLNFNSPKKAAYVTEVGRDILTKGMEWVKGRGYELVNVDTDSFSYSKGRKVEKDEFDQDITHINTLYPDGIIWELMAGM